MAWVMGDPKMRKLADILANEDMNPESPLYNSFSTNAHCDLRAIAEGMGVSNRDRGKINEEIKKLSTKQKRFVKQLLDVELFEDKIKEQMEQHYNKWVK